MANAFKDPFIIHFTYLCEGDQVPVARGQLRTCHEGQYSQLRRDNFPQPTESCYFILKMSRKPGNCWVVLMNIMKGCRHWEIFLRNSNGGNRHNKWGLESRPRSCWPSSSPPSSSPPPPSHATFGSKIAEPAQPDSLVMKWSKTWKRMWKWNHEAARAKADVLVNLRQVAKKKLQRASDLFFLTSPGLVHGRTRNWSYSSPLCNKPSQLHKCHESTPSLPS